MKATGIKLLFPLSIFTIISSITLFSNTNLVYAKSSTNQHKAGDTDANSLPVGSGGSTKEGDTNQHTAGDTDANNLPVGSGGSTKEGDTNQHTAGDTDANSLPVGSGGSTKEGDTNQHTAGDTDANSLPVGSGGSTKEGDTNQHTVGDTDANSLPVSTKEGDTNQHTAGDTDANNLPVGSGGSTKEGDTNQHTAGDTDANNLPVGSGGSTKEGDTNQHTAGDTDANSNKPTKVSYNVAYPLGFTTSKLQGNMYADLAIGVGLSFVTDTLTSVTEFVGLTGNTQRSGSAQGSSSVLSNNLVGINFNAGIGYELIVKTRSKINFYTALGFSYNLLSGNGTSVSNSVNANVVDGVYYEGNVLGLDSQITYNSGSTSIANINQADLLHIVGAKVKLGISMLKDRLKVYGTVGLGALLPMHVTGNISVNNNVSEVLQESVVASSDLVAFSSQGRPSESLQQQEHTADLSPVTATSAAAFLPGGGVGISYDIVPRRLAVFFEFEGMPVIHTAGAAVLNSNTFTDTGKLGPVGGADVAQVTNTVTSTVSNGPTALFMLRTGMRLGF